MQSVSSRNWTRIAVSIFCNDNHYTTGTSNNKSLMQGQFSTQGPLPLVSIRLREWSTQLTALLDWPPPLDRRGQKTSVIIWFSDAYTFSFRCNSCNLFPLSLVYLKTQLHIQFTKSTVTGYQRSICKILIELFLN